MSSMVMVDMAYCKFEGKSRRRVLIYFQILSDLLTVIIIFSDYLHSKIERKTIYLIYAMGDTYLETSIFEYIIDVFILLAETNYQYILVSKYLLTGISIDINL